MKITNKHFLPSLFWGLFGILFLSQAYSADGLPAEGMAAEKEMSTAGESNISQKEAEPNLNQKEMATESDATLSSTKSKITEQPSAEMTGFSRGTVARSIFTTLIDNREPVDKVKEVPNKTSDVFYFTELRDMSGQTAKHRWEYKGKVVAEVDFKIRGNRWRVWSKKSFQPGWSGDWKVSVINGADEVISEEMIAFTEPTPDKIDDNAMDKPMNDMLENKTNASSTPALN